MSDEQYGAGCADWRERGARAKKIWQENYPGEQQYAFAERLRQLGLDIGDSTVNRIMRGNAAMPIHAVPYFAALDKQERGLAWLAWGSEEPPPMPRKRRAR